MNRKLHYLNNEIISLKSTLYFLMNHNNHTDEAVVICSQKLDKLIVEYELRKNNLKMN